MDAKEFSQLLKDHPEILENRKQFQSILRDLYPSERGNVNLMIAAHSAGVPTLLRRNIPKDFRAAQITHLLVDDYSIATEKARWVAQLWVEAYELS